MTRKVFDRELEILHRDITMLGARVETILVDTAAALQTNNREMAQRIYSEDPEINASRNQIEQMCVNLIALQQPLARDLRAITATLKMVTDVERVADQCADICEIMITYPELNQMKVPQTIVTMFEKATEMFAEAIDSFIRQDADLAATIRPKDDVVDSLFSKTIIEMSKLIQADQAFVSQATDYMFIAKYLERIADHATNVAEWTIYAVTGRHTSMKTNIVDRDLTNELEN
ncbi:MAG TPA: phosphate signaling complex protein PhoU [Clostridiaceae bacterium]|nr:phosphate signaling complex protein PhoU [Clostridiaceae bacterium]